MCHLMPLLGLIGVALSLMLSFFTIMLVRWYFANRYVHINRRGYYVFLVAMFLLVYAADLYIDSYLKYIVDAFLVALIVYNMREELFKMIKVILNK